VALLSISTFSYIDLSFLIPCVYSNLKQYFTVNSYNLYNLIDNDME